MMKRIRILTIHFGTNHGSVLQAYALAKHLNNAGNEAKIIDYIPKRYNIWSNLLERKKGKYPWPIIIAYYPIHLLKVLPVRNMFERFCRDILFLTGRVTNPKDLKSVATEGDIFIAGSDQIWNEDYNGFDDFSYYFDFLPDEKKRIAYAASFGKEALFEEKYGEKVVEYLKKFDWIGMRESTGVDKLAHYGISGVHVCDPTMLLSQEEWRNFAKDSKYKQKDSKPYLLVYVMDGVYDKLLECAQIIKRELGYNIVVVAFNKITDGCIDRMVFKVNPRDFVTLVDGATCVITNSFHGTVFSIIFEKPSVILGKSKYNSRMLGLLEKLGMTDRFIPKDTLIKDEQLLNIIQNKEQMKKAQALLSKWIKTSKELLDSAIE